jgi:hypothetical protein
MIIQSLRAFLVSLSRFWIVWLCYDRHLVHPWSTKPAFTVRCLKFITTFVLYFDLQDIFVNFCVGLSEISRSDMIRDALKTIFQHFAPPTTRTFA